MGSDAVFVQGTFPSFIDVCRRPRARLEILLSLSLFIRSFLYGGRGIHPWLVI